MQQLMLSFYNIRKEIVFAMFCLFTVCFAAFAQTPPNSPDQFQAAAVTSSSVGLTWNDNSDNEDGFTIERSVDASNFSAIAMTNANTTSYTDSGLPDSSLFYYRIKAFNTIGDSAYSLPVSVTTLPLSVLAPFAPADLQAKISLPPDHLAWFYKPPINNDTFTLSKAFQIYVLTKQDEPTRDDLKAKGVNSTFLQYLVSNEIQDPGSCTIQPYRNQVADQIGDFCNISANHPDWFLLDKQGVRISAASGTRRTYYMDPGNAGWRAFWISRAKLSQETLGWDGVFLDNVDASLRRFTRLNQIPAKYPDDASYRAAVESYLNDLYNSYFKPNHRPLQANIIEMVDPSAWFQYLNDLDGAMNENFATNWDPNYLDTATWLEHLSRTEQSVALGKQVILVGQGDQYNTTRQQFAYGSYLLVAAPGVSFRYTKNTSYTAIWLYNNYDIDLGEPKGARYQLSDGTWRRNFKKGYVVVDPSARTAQITSVAGNQVDLSWNDMADNEQGFEIERSTDATSFVQIESAPPDSNQYSDTLLNSDTDYYYRIKAFNAGGDSAYTSAPRASTNPQVPDAPGSLTATTVSTSQIQLAWTPASTTETGFKVERSLDGSNFSVIAILPAGSNAFSDSNLLISTTYYYRVEAFNSGGISSSTGIVNSTTLSNGPAAPTNLTATTNSSTQINLTWSDNSSNEDGFKIERSNDGLTFTEITSVAKNIVSYSDSGLSSLTVYYYRVRAYNSGGASAYTNTANAQTNGTAPLAPSSLKATTISASQIALSWTDSSSNEDGFQIERSTDNNNFAQIATLPSNSATFSDSSLTSATTYYYRVRAYNQWGISAYSNTATATTNSNIPAAPSNLIASAASSSQINLSWTDNSSNEQGFQLERSTDGVTFVQITSPASNVSSTSDTGLAAGTKYYYRIRAYNSSGNSAYSNIANATTSASITLPVAPSNLSASGISKTQIKLTWKDNASNESGFKIERSTNGTTFTQIATTGANVVTYTSGGLTRNTVYYYRVRAYNSAGNSAYSNVSSGRTWK